MLWVKPCVRIQVCKVKKPRFIDYFFCSLFFLSLLLSGVLCIRWRIYDIRIQDLAGQTCRRATWLPEPSIPGMGCPGALLAEQGEAGARCCRASSEDAGSLWGGPLWEDAVLGAPGWAEHPIILAGLGWKPQGWHWALSCSPGLKWSQASRVAAAFLTPMGPAF